MDCQIENESENCSIEIDNYSLVLIVKVDNDKYQPVVVHSKIWKSKNSLHSYGRDCMLELAGSCTSGVTMSNVI